jgi:alpha-D-xyloside xylohydrolase
MRWTQMAVFLSHLRYHGASPREPYEYPAIADIVRRWLRLRYALIPYLIDQGNATTSSGYPVVRALALHHSDDPACWQVDDQFYCGGDLMVAPVMNDEGVRNVYLPEGEWVDLWNGEVLAGPRLLRSLRVPLERTPVYARRGSEMRVYPERVDCVDHMDLGRSEPLRFDQSYRGLASSVLARVSGLT